MEGDTGTPTAHHQLIVRDINSDGIVVIRELEGYEYLRFIGWDVSDWNCEVKDRKHYSHEMMRSLAGNAFSGFCLISQITAAVAYMGQSSLILSSNDSDDDLEGLKELIEEDLREEGMLSPKTSEPECVDTD